MQFVIICNSSLAPFCTIEEDDTTYAFRSTVSEGLDSTASCAAALEVTASSNCVSQCLEDGLYLKSLPYTLVLGSPFLREEHFPLAHFGFGWYWS